MIRQIEKEELRKMHGREGLILQGCGGELKEWTEGINQILEQEGILPKGKRLDDVAVFRNEGMTNLLLFFGEEKTDIGKLAAWRLQTRYQFGSMWMSDYVNNRLGGFLRENVTEKPNCALIGEDGNIFNLMKIASRTLRENGLDDKAEEMEKRITKRKFSMYISKAEEGGDRRSTVLFHGSAGKKRCGKSSMTCSPPAMTVISRCSGAEAGYCLAGLRTGR